MRVTVTPVRLARPSRPHRSRPGRRHRRDRRQDRHRAGGFDQRHQPLPGTGQFHPAGVRQHPGTGVARAIPPGDGRPAPAGGAPTAHGTGRTRHPRPGRFPGAALAGARRRPARARPRAGRAAFAAVDGRPAARPEAFADLYNLLLAVGVREQALADVATFRDSEAWGIHALDELLERIGIEPGASQLVEGTGLSRCNPAHRRHGAPAGATGRAAACRRMARRAALAGRRRQPGLAHARHRRGEQPAGQDRQHERRAQPGRRRHHGGRD
ncbi:hypothetical protein LSPH26S_03818 [Lysinibacillus sphaericus]